MKTKVLFCVSSHSGLYDTIMCSLYATRWCLFFAYMAFLCGFHTTCLWLTYIMSFVQDFLLSQLDLSLIYLSAVFHLRRSVIIWPVHDSSFLSKYHWLHLHPIFNFKVPTFSTKKPSPINESEVWQNYYSVICLNIL